MTILDIYGPWALIIKNQHYDEDGAPQRAGQSGTGKSLVCSCSGWNNKKSRSFLGYTGTSTMYIYLLSGFGNII